MLDEDCARVSELAEMGFPMMKKVFVYPFGKYSQDSGKYLKAAGYTVTVTVQQGINRISVGDDLHLLKRIPAEWYVTGDTLLAKIRG